VEDKVEDIRGRRSGLGELGIEYHSGDRDRGRRLSTFEFYDRQLLFSRLGTSSYK